MCAERNGGKRKVELHSVPPFFAGEGEGWEVVGSEDPAAVLFPPLPPPPRLLRTNLIFLPSPAFPRISPYTSPQEKVGSCPTCVRRMCVGRRSGVEMFSGKKTKEEFRRKGEIGLEREGAPSSAVFEVRLSDCAIQLEFSPVSP